MDLAEFLLARIAEDEVAAGVMRENESWNCDCNEPHDAHIHVWWPGMSDLRSPDWVFDSPRMLAECEAKRRIVYYLQGVDFARGDYDVARDRVLQHLAVPYADHPDYRQEWAPTVAV